MTRERGLPGAGSPRFTAPLDGAGGDWQTTPPSCGGAPHRARCCLSAPRLTAETVQQSTDGTRKYLWRLADGEAIESVLIPSGNRLTLCISSQAVCALCLLPTGLMGFRRNLSAWEIAGQVRQIVLANPAEKPTNIVFAGMGEPLLNWSAVDTALTILNDPAGLGIGARHITVSTVGIIPGMLALAAARAVPSRHLAARSGHGQRPYHADPEEIPDG